MQVILPTNQDPAARLCGHRDIGSLLLTKIYDKIKYQQCAILMYVRVSVFAINRPAVVLQQPSRLGGGSGLHISPRGNDTSSANAGTLLFSHARAARCHIRVLPPSPQKILHDEGVFSSVFLEGRKCPLLNSFFTRRVSPSNM